MKNPCLSFAVWLLTAYSLTGLWLAGLRSLLVYAAP